MDAEELTHCAKYIDDFGHEALAQTAGYRAFARQAREAICLGGDLDLTGIELMRSSSVFLARSRSVPHCPTSISTFEDLGDAYAAMFYEEDGFRRFVNALYLRECAAKVCMDAHTASGGLIPLRVLDPAFWKAHRGWLGFNGEMAAHRVMTILRDLAAVPMQQEERQLVREAADILAGGMFTEEFRDHILDAGPVQSPIDRSRWRMIDDLVDILDGEAAADRPAMHTMLGYLHAEIRSLVDPAAGRADLVGRTW